MIHRPGLVRARPDVLSRRSMLRGAVGLGLGAAVGVDDAMASHFRLRQRSGSGSHIPAGATVLNTESDWINAMYSGADGTNYVFAANGGASWGTLNSTFNARHTKTGADPKLHFYMQPGTVINSIHLDGVHAVAFHYMTLSGGVIAWNLDNSGDLLFDHVAADTCARGFHTGTCQRIVLSWCKVTNATGLGIDINTSQFIDMDNVLVDGFNGDAFDIFTSDDVTLNTFRAQRPLDPGGGHLDGLQISIAFGQSTGCNRVTCSNGVYDRGTSAFGAQGLGFCEASTFVHLSNLASRGVGDPNGAQFSACSDSDMTDIWINSWDFPDARLIVRDASARCTINRISAPTAAQTVDPTFPNTAITVTNETLLTALTGPTDRGGFDTYCAAKGLPLASHWDNQGFL